MTARSNDTPWRRLLTEHDIGVNEVWLRYFEFGGLLSLNEVASFVDGKATGVGDGDRLMIRHALVEVLGERGVTAPAEEA